MVLDAEIEPRDVRGAPDGTHDFDLLLASGRRIAVEVSRALRSGLLEQLRTLSGWTTTDLQLHWTVVVRDEHVRVKNLNRVVEPVLQSIEPHLPGVPFPKPDGDESVSAIELASVPQALVDVGVVEVMFFPAWAPVGYVSVRAPHGAFEPLETAFAEIEERIVAKAETLAGSAADERHVFVWIESPHQSHGTYNFRTEDLPVGKLHVAAGVDVVWVAGSRASNDESLPWTHVVWRYTVENGWSRHGTFLEFWRALGMRQQLGMPPDPESPSTEARFRPRDGWPVGWRVSQP